MATPTINHDARWRPTDHHRRPPCRYTFRATTCTRRGAHYCKPRADRVIAFFTELLVHTKGVHVNHQFAPTDWQEHEILRPLFGEVLWSPEHDCYARRYRVAHIVVARKNGKGLGVTTPILTADGWRKMGDLRPGDKVHAVDGTLTDVIWVSDEWNLPCYRVTFANGESIVADEQHQWTVYNRHGYVKGTGRGGRNGAWQTMSTPDLMSTYKEPGGGHRYSVRVDRVIERSDIDLAMDPYLLGAWLGDGSSHGARITTRDPSVLDAFRRAGYGVSDYGNDLEYGITGGFQVLLRQEDVLRNKHVPESYLLGSADQRMALLQGLMDTDGAVNRGPNTPRVEFCNTNKQLADAVLFLARSLGWKATIKESRATLDGRDCGLRWRVCWTAWRDRPPFRLQRKIDALAPHPGRDTRSVTNQIVSVEPVPSEPTRCIGVEHPDHQFLAGEGLVPTHNSELAAGILLYMLIGDDEDASECFSAAKDTKQAGKVFEPANAMRRKSPVLSKRLKWNKNARRIYDEQTDSYYEIITSDAKGELGHNPHCFNLDEVLSQPDAHLWEAMSTAVGARLQELLFTTTTETNEPSSFGADLIDEASKVMYDPQSAPHIFAYVRKMPRDDDELAYLHTTFDGHPDLPVSLDPFDEANWAWPNPALDDFKSREAMRRQAQEARAEPAKENAFRQFQCNQRVSQLTRWLPLHLWDACTQRLITEDALAGRRCFAGLDLAATTDLAAIAYLFPPNDDENGLWDIVWRAFTPEAQFVELDKHLAGKAAVWQRDGLLTVTPGDWVDFDAIERTIDADAQTFDIVQLGYDPWNAPQTIQHLIDGGLECVPVRQGYQTMSPTMGELMRMIRMQKLNTGGHPVARWNADSLDVVSDTAGNIKPAKPERKNAGRRIDLIVALLHALYCKEQFVEQPERELWVAFTS